MSLLVNYEFACWLFSPSSWFRFMISCSFKKVCYSLIYLFGHPEIAMSESGFHWQLAACREVCPSTMARRHGLDRADCTGLSIVVWPINSLESTGNVIMKWHWWSVQSWRQRSHLMVLTREALKLWGLGFAELQPSERQQIWLLLGQMFVYPKHWANGPINFELS